MAPLVGSHDLGHRDRVPGVELAATPPLRLTVLDVLPPGVHVGHRLELDDRDVLAVVGGVAAVLDVARLDASQLGDPDGLVGVGRRVLRTAAGAEHDDHVGLVRHDADRRSDRPVDRRRFGEETPASIRRARPLVRHAGGVSPEARRRSQLALLAAPVVWIGLIGTIALLASPDPQELSEDVAVLVDREILVIGDALVGDAEAQILTVLAGTDLRIDATAGRPLARGLEIDGAIVLDDLEAEPPEILVVALARNDLGDAEHEDAVAETMDTFSDSCMVWVTGTPAEGATMASVNDVIRRQAGTRAHVHVADWAEAVSDQGPAWFNPGTASLTDDGRWGLARTIASQIVADCL